MSDNPKSFEKESVVPLTHQRILTLMAVVIILVSIITLIINSWLFAIGVFFGGLLSFLNYYWMKWSLKGAFEAAIDGEKPRYLGARYILRYFTFGLILAVVYLTKTVPVMAVILGLASFAFAVVIEGIIRIFSSSN